MSDSKKPEIQKPPLAPTSSIPKQTPDPIFVMTIELEQGKVGNIKIYQDSNAEELSYDFCHQNNLDFHSLNYLKEQIQELIDEYKRKHNIKPNVTEPSKEKKEDPLPTEEKSKLISYERMFNAYKNQKKDKGKVRLNKNTKINKLIQKVKTAHAKYSRQESNRSLHYSKNLTASNLQNESCEHNDKKKYPVANSNNKLYIPSSHFNTKRSNSIDSRKNNNSKKKNYGELLYERGQADLKTKQKKISEIKNQLRLQTEQNYTFKPRIYSSSPNITQKNDYNCRTQVTQENKTNHFTHKKNGNSAGPIRKHNSTKFFNRKRKSPCPVRNSSPMNKTSNFHTENIKIPFSTRQRFYQKRNEENINKIRNELYPPNDKETGQLFFQPKLCTHHSSKAKNKHNGNIFTNLYSYADKYKYNQMHRNDQANNEIIQMSNKSKLSVNTEEIFQRKKNDVFKYIFKQFDSDEDGLISIYTIDTKKVPDYITSILNPILIDLKDYQGTITESDFITECQKLFDVCIIIFNMNIENALSAKEKVT